MGILLPNSIAWLGLLRQGVPKTCQSCSRPLYISKNWPASTNCLPTPWKRRRPYLLQGPSESNNNLLANSIAWMAASSTGNSKDVSIMFSPVSPDYIRTYIRTRLSIPHALNCHAASPLGTSTISVCILERSPLLAFVSHWLSSRH
jgi:hypothetical protein